VKEAVLILLFSAVYTQEEEIFEKSDDIIILPQPLLFLLFS
jgi:hypothetical protein